MKRILIAATALAFALVGVAAADPGHGKGQGQGEHDGGPNWHNVDDYAGRARVEDMHHGEHGHDAMESGRWTPPGLAKKPHGLPPGQAKKMWSQGERMPSQYYSQQRYYVPEPARYNLSPAPVGMRWIQVGDQYYLTRTDNGLVREVVAALLR